MYWLKEASEDIKKLLPQIQEMVAKNLSFTPGMMGFSVALQHDLQKLVKDTNYEVVSGTSLGKDYKRGYIRVMNKKEEIRVYCGNTGDVVKKAHILFDVYKTLSIVPKGTPKKNKVIDILK